MGMVAPSQATVAHIAASSSWITRPVRRATLMRLSAPSAVAFRERTLRMFADWALGLTDALARRRLRWLCWRSARRLAHRLEQNLTPACQGVNRLSHSGQSRLEGGSL